MTHPTSEQLSDYLDDDLSPTVRAGLANHLTTCADCAALLAELRRVVSRAQALDDHPPAADLWPGVAAAIGATPPARRPSFSWPQLLAASVALVVLSGGAVAVLLRTPEVVPPQVVAATEPDAVLPAGAGGTVARGYDAAILALEAELAAGRSRLDSTTIRVVAQKLALIDRAILEAEHALASDSGSTYLHGHLAQTRLRKLDLLRRATALTRQVS